VLLVLDNLEHLVDGAPVVGKLVATCPHLTIVVTSREPTRLAAERVYPVGPLEVPGPGGAAVPAELERFGAVTMFCDRARARDPCFSLDEDNAAHVREICRRLDGLPLALELAAARIGLLTLPELAARLGRALTVLSGGVRDAPERHRTLRATIDWSFQLLSGAERRTFARMAVFPAGATVTAAETVTGAALDTLESLVSKQLLVHRGRRLVMLEIVREYALERLAEDADATALDERLATWSLGSLREATPHLAKADRAGWLDSLDAELPNVLAALTWALEDRRAELALQLVGELGEYWWRSNRWRDGLRWIDTALEHAEAASESAHAKALLYRARLHGLRRYIRDRQDLQAALELYRRCGDEAGIAACLGHLAVAEAWTGQHERARALSDDAVRSAEAAHDDEVVAAALATGVLVSADYGDAAGRARTAVAHLARVGSLFDVALVCNVTGYLAIVGGRYEEALPWLDQGLDAARRLGSLHAEYLVCGNLGLARLFLDELDESAEAFCDALAICREAGDEGLVDETLLGVAAVAARRGDLRRAAQLVGAARAHETPEANRDEKAMSSRLIHEILPRGRDRYGPENWDPAQREGASLSVGEAIDLALARGRFASRAPSLSAPRLS
jgi:predicted ATPase